MPLQTERSDWWIAAGVAAVLHIALILFLLRTMRSSDAPRVDAVKAPAAEESYRDIPAAPDGIPMDTIPLSGLRGPPGEDHPIIVTCKYELNGTSAPLRLLNGPLASTGTLGCGTELRAAPRMNGAHIRLHYDPFGSLLGITGHDQAAQFFETVRAWQLARPRAGRQWQAPVILDVTITTQ
jgi:hypothetical protein